MKHSHPSLALGCPPLSASAPCERGTQPLRCLLARRYKNACLQLVRWDPQRACFHYSQQQPASGPTPSFLTPVLRGDSSRSGVSQACPALGSQAPASPALPHRLRRCTSLGRFPDQESRTSSCIFATIGEHKEE